jgi:hypothetical protein
MADVRRMAMKLALIEATANGQDVENDPAFWERLPTATKQRLERAALSAIVAQRECQGNG